MDGQFPPDYNLYPQQQGNVQNYEEAMEYTGQVQQTPYGAEKSRQEHERERLRLEEERLRLEEEQRARQDTAFLFTDKKIRNSFIRKVYSILTMQLVIASSMIVLVHHHKPTREFFSRLEVLIGAFILEFIMFFILICCRTIARTSPINYMFLFMYTISNGILTSVISSFYDFQTVLVAVGITALICFFITVFAFQTSIDFTGYGMCLCVILLEFSFISCFLVFFVPERPREIIVGGVGILIFSVILIYDTQLMIGGNHRYAISPEEYVFASLMLYIDVIQIFLYVLEIFGTSD